MQQELTISLGQCSETGRKEINQDFFGALIPVQPALSLKGISVVIADGISSSKVSRVAAESVIKSFLTDYYCTSDTWTVKTSGLRVIRAASSWLFADTKRSIHAHDMERGYVCTFAALVLKSHIAHLFHVGDSRIYRLEGDSLEQLTEDHRTVVSGDQSYLARAIGMEQTVDVDYRALPLSVGDVFVLATDGVYEHINPKTVSRLIGDNADDLDKAARLIVKAAYDNGSPDNLTAQIVRIDTLPARDRDDILARSETLPAPPLPEAGQEFEGYQILRPLHANHRSHIYLVQDIETGQKAALKIPSIDLREDKQALARLMMEDWIARRVSSAHVLKPAPQIRPHNYIYTVTEYIEGQTLAQWMTDNPKCDLETMRGIVEQIAKGLRALHRKEMLHQDLRPENIMIDTNGTVKIIDFGAVRVAGVSETGLPGQGSDIPGTMQYTAPEYFLHEAPSKSSDYFSLGVIAYQMLTGRLPYGAQVAKIRTRAQLRKLRYSPTLAPDWLDATLQKMVHPDPFKRYSSLSEFVADIRHPNNRFRTGKPTPLAQRDPVKFWQVIATVLALAVVVLTGRIVSLQNAEPVIHTPQ
ncbi:bifunctional protein-serine/threonine kinase/phosphatase [Profundibacter amoris]|uniref:Bifunctional protein-serine/threonine kinase/phosphatase n=1 Tax=Profundibacter amoris TaxID=2171755 RepID=A0A347UCX8_9RHOB|nr:bifunctional protein-serine/threonine kinase/phosphatase [Profundibacter amoris]AXX96706.1 bifunctional protein-serine/threonine kinase/phosphatase [Profundibacter amoris]